MKIKMLLLLLLCCPLLFSAVGSHGDDGKQEAPADEATETPFLLLATVHNYGYIEPCG
ncbi:MAG: hypothetical protein VYD70_02535 [Planctomycetota bacterium]|nr:hypothetical protein [Planctomycetota bacterium]